jgi:hypothetical protein
MPTKRALRDNRPITEERDVITLRKLAEMKRNFRRARDEEARLLAERMRATVH